MSVKNRNLTILSEAEKFVLYGFPDFDDDQRMEYLIFSEQELALCLSRPTLHAQVHCALQIGYFKAKHSFFQFSWEESQEDRAFILTRYFNNERITSKVITRHEYYAQCQSILYLFGYKSWSNKFSLSLSQKAASIAKRDVSPSFLVSELISYFAEQKIVRPGYTTLQTLISEALSSERKRLCELLENLLGEPEKAVLQQLLVRDDTLLNLAIIKQDAKHFGYRQMSLERQKRSVLEPLYKITKTIVHKLDISQQNLNYYASLANFYTIYDLRRLRPSQSHLYLLCYAWKRYRQFTDNLVDAMGYHMKKLEEETKTKADKHYLSGQDKYQQESHEIGRLLLLYVDDGLIDSTSFGTIREQAFTIMPKDILQTTGQRLIKKSASKQTLRWQTALLQQESVWRLNLSKW